MSEHTGDGTSAGDPGASGPQIIKLGTVASAGRAAQDAAPPARGRAARSSAERDPFAPSRYRLTRRRAVVLGVLAVLAVGGWAGYERGTQWWQHRSETRQVAAHDDAVTDATPLLDGYRFPASVGPATEGTLCFLRGVRCGTTAAAPAAALAEIAPTLTALGFELGDDPRDQCEPRGQRFERCSPNLLLDGVDVGSLSIQRDNFEAKAFGSGTQVALYLSQTSTSTDGYTGPPVPVPVADPATQDMLPPDLVEAARCTKRTDAGCLTYEATVTVPGSTYDAFAHAGRFAVAHGWATSGYCPGGVRGHCDLYVSHRRGTDVVERAGVAGAFDPVAGGTRVVLTWETTRTTTT